MIGIVAYGASVPRGRIAAAELCAARLAQGERSSAAGVRKLAVASADQDGLTLGLEAGRAALRRSGPVDAVRIGAVVVGSNEPLPPDAPESLRVAEALDANPHGHASRLQQPAMAGMLALNSTYCQVRSKAVDLGLALGVDLWPLTAQPPLRPWWASAAAALLLGRREAELIATIDAVASRRSVVPGAADTPADVSGTGAGGLGPAGRQAVWLVRELFARQRFCAADFHHAVLPQPDAHTPPAIAKALGFAERQLAGGLYVSRVGAAPNAGVLLGLALVLDKAEPGQRVLVCDSDAAYGADVWALTVTARVADAQAAGPRVRQMLDETGYELSAAQVAARMLAERAGGWR